MKYVKSYWVEYHESGIIQLLINTKERWEHFHRFNDHMYGIGDYEDIDTSTPEGLQEYKDHILEIPKSELVFNKDVHFYICPVQQEKEQISFYFIPVEMVMRKEMREIIKKRQEFIDKKQKGTN